MALYPLSYQDNYNNNNGINSNTSKYDVKTVHTSREQMQINYTTLHVNAIEVTMGLALYWNRDGGQCFPLYQKHILRFRGSLQSRLQLF